MRYADIYGPKPEDASYYKLTFGEDSERTRARMRELIIYIAEKSRGDMRFGATKLNKILYYSDFLAFREYGQSITGARYMRLEHGPAPTHLKPLREEMLASKDITSEKIPYYTRDLDVVKPLRTANVDLFEKRELILVDAIISELRQFDAHEVSTLSHTRAWTVAGQRESIPYEAIYLSDEGLTEDDIDWAYSSAVTAGLIDAPF